MLGLTRTLKKYRTILILPDKRRITVDLVKIEKGHTVRLAIDAPADVVILREEVENRAENGRYGGEAVG